MAEPTIAETPSPPYVAVIFTSLRTADDNGYAAMAAAMEAVAREQPGYLGIEAAHEDIGHHGVVLAGRGVGGGVEAGRRPSRGPAAGREAWYRDYRVRIAHVTRTDGPR